MGQVMARSLPSIFSGSALPGALVGILAFFIVMPANVLDPGNIGWLGLHEDTKTYYLAWDYFRRLPWGAPISQNSDYGIEIAASVFMADVVPLMAIPLKLFAPYLGRVFQYHGIWLFLCFALQGYFAWKIASSMTDKNVQRALICGLFVFQLIFIKRAGGHLPLMAHFYILASIYLCLLNHKSFSPFWLLVIGCAACTNAYLLVMTLALWLSDFVRRALLRVEIPTLLLEGISVAAVVGFLCWQVGYFSVGSGVRAAGFEYGLYRFNLLSFFDPNDWSLFFKDIPGGPGDSEGFAYLGLGVFLLLLMSLLPLLSQGRKDAMQNLPVSRSLLIAAIALALYSVTSHIGIGLYTFVVPLPDELTGILAVFRGAGRFIWPVVYMGLIVALFLVCRNFNARSATVLLTYALTAQIVDSSAGWLPIRTAVQQAAGGSWPSPLKSPFWAEAAKIYRAVRRVPALKESPGWEIFADYANRHQMRTDSVYLARFDLKKLAALNADSEQRLLQGNYDDDTLYVVRERYVEKAAVGIDPDKDLLTEVDGYAVVAPNWAARSGLVINPITKMNYLPVPTAGSAYSVDRPGGVAIRCLVGGWSPEVGAGGVWSEGPSARLSFPSQKPSFDALEFIGTPLVSTLRPVLKIVISVNGGERQVRELDGSMRSFSIHLTDADRAAISRDSALNVTFEFPDLRSPSDLHINVDRRLISFSLESIKFH